MNIEEVDISQLLREAAMAKLEKESVEILQIRFMLGNHGIYVAVSAGRANRATFDDIMGPGWTNRLGNEVGDILERDQELAAAIKKAGREIAVRAEEKMREEGRL